MGKFLCVIWLTFLTLRFLLRPTTEPEHETSCSGAVAGSVGLGQQVTNIVTSVADDPSVSQSVFTITEKAPTWAFSWLKVPNKTL